MFIIEFVIHPLVGDISWLIYQLNYNFFSQSVATAYMQLMDSLDTC